ncbi:MAG: hypothetical protein PVF58_18665 [Candidatus Methanofastidiosia archaeon]|jgi:hypothetical protein
MSKKELFNQKEKLMEKRESRICRLNRIQRLYYLSFVLGLIFISFGFLKLISDILSHKEMIPLEHLMLLIFGTTAVIASVTIGRAKIQALKEEIQDTEFEVDLFTLRASPEESRAEKLLRINQIQLRRYYDINLSQNRWIFAVGVLCIFLGVGIVGATLYSLVRFAEQSASADVEKVIVGVVGSIGTILTNYVARIFLSMYKEIAKSLTMFHTKLISTHKLFLANLLISRIDNTEKREDTLSKLALSLQDTYGEREDTNG